MIDMPFDRHWFMHTSHAVVGLTAPEKLRKNQSPPPTTTLLPSEPSPEIRTLRVGLIAGPEANWDLAAAQLAEHLRRDQRLEVYHAWDWVELGIDDPIDYDCVVLLGWPAGSSRERIKRIELYCRGGGSLVALRAMHAEIPDWPNFAEEVLGGRQSAGQQCRLLEVEQSQSGWHHPVVQDVECMVAEGEIYRGPRLPPDTTVLLNAHTGQRVEPVAWTRRYEGGRVFCSTLGLEDDFRGPKFLRLISNAVYWTGTVHG